MNKINNIAIIQQGNSRVWTVSLLLLFGLRVMNVAGQATPPADLSVNRMETIYYDGNNKVVSHTKEYFGPAGEPLQTQQKNFSRGQVLATTTVKDANGRAVLTTLSAPIGKSTFEFKDLFFVNETNAKFGYSDFGSPGKVGHDLPGTLGWYYGSQNNMETHVPVSDFPYTQVNYYDDGTGGIRFQAEAGESHRIGSGLSTETASRTFMCRGDELGNYYGIRPLILPYTFFDFANDAVVNVTRDPNQNYSLSVVDTKGHTLMTAMAGTLEDYDMKFYRTYSITPDDKREFYLLQPQDIQLNVTRRSTGKEIIRLEELLANDATSPLMQPGINSFRDGFFRFDWKFRDSWVRIEFATAIYLKNISYYYYDAYGRLVAEMSPKSVRQIRKEGKSVADVAKITYNYNFKGQLLSMTDPDKGRIDYQHRRDGRLRFSQGANQVSPGYFAYTHYDRLGRPIESGEYTGTTYSFVNLGDQLEYVDQVYFSRDNTRDWLKTAYDLPDLRPTVGLHTITNLPAGVYPQTNLRGAVSYTENANVTTWYSYDEFGRVAWMIQKPKDVALSFVVRYSYDFIGNVLKVSNLTYNETGALQKEFYHHYTYDADQRLSKVYTSVQEAGSRKLRATYEYYLHGPLKRIELGSKTQGVDFVYNIQGWLTQINHPDPLQDPGNDENDAFGMVLDYYKSDMNNLFPTAVVPDPHRGHAIPEQPRLAVNHTPLIRFAPEPFTSENSANSFFKDFSVSDPRYKRMPSSTTIPSN